MNCNYLAFEGIDGSGKTSFIEGLCKILENQSKKYKVVREPGGTELGEGIRKLLLSHEYKVPDLSEAFLFCANRAELIKEVVIPEIESGSIVVSDRSAYSSIAYQGAGRELGVDQIYELNNIALDGFWPEKVVLLDIDPKISLERQKISDRIGSSEVNFFHRARQGYLDLADKYPDKFLVVDAEKEFSKNLDLICEWLNIGKT